MWTGLKPKVNTLGLKMRQLVLVNAASFSPQHEIYTMASEIRLMCGSLSPLLSSRRWAPKCRDVLTFSAARPWPPVPEVINGLEEYFLRSSWKWLWITQLY